MSIVREPTLGPSMPSGRRAREATRLDDSLPFDNIFRIAGTPPRPLAPETPPSHTKPLSPPVPPPANDAPYQRPLEKDASEPDVGEERPSHSAARHQQSADEERVIRPLQDAHADNQTHTTEQSRLADEQAVSPPPNASEPEDAAAPLPQQNPDLPEHASGDLVPAGDAARLAARNRTFHSEAQLEEAPASSAGEGAMQEEVPAGDNADQQPLHAAGGRQAEGRGPAVTDGGPAADRRHHDVASSEERSSASSPLEGPSLQGEADHASLVASSTEIDTASVAAIPPKGASSEPDGAAPNTTRHRRPDARRSPGGATPSSDHARSNAADPGSIGRPNTVEAPAVTSDSAPVEAHQPEISVEPPDAASRAESARLSTSHAADQHPRHSPHEASRTEQASTTTRPALSSADATRFVQRVSRAIELAHHRGESLQIRLSPPELGSLRIEIAIRGGMLTAHLEADTNAARNALLDKLPVLRDRLAEQDVRVERFEVDVREQSGGRSGERSPAFGDGRRPSAEWTPERRRHAARADEQDQIRPRPLPVRIGPGELNLVV